MNDEHLSPRNETLDGMKFLLIVLVAFGHFSEPYRYTHNPIGAVYSGIYLFHMPLFILLSGYFSKKITGENIRKTFFNTWEAYTIMAFSSVVLITKDLHALIVPTSSYWYLMSLMWWKLILYVLKKFIHRNALILLLSWAFIPVAMILINNHTEALSIMKTVCFFPFFIIGTMLTENDLKKIRSKKRILTGMSLVIFIFIFTFSSRYVHELEWHRKGIYQLMEECGYSMHKILLSEVAIYTGSIIVSFWLLSLEKLPGLFANMVNIHWYFMYYRKFHGI